jgi:hypothetical protein
MWFRVLTRHQQLLGIAAISIVGAMPTAPTGCATVGSGTSTSYTLAAGDVGKYITAHVFVNNTDPQGQMTASNNNAVLASGAVAPPAVADPAGKPTIVNIPNPIVSVAGGTQVTITGTGLAGVTCCNSWWFACDCGFEDRHHCCSSGSSVDKDWISRLDRHQRSRVL